MTGMDLAALSGGVAVITGSGSTAGLGFGLAREAAKLGMRVCISDVRQDAIDEAVAQLSAETPGVTVAGCACDVTDYSSVEALVAFAQSEFGGAPLQFVGANAGVIFPTTTILTGTEPVVLSFCPCVCPGPAFANQNVFATKSKPPVWFSACRLAGGVGADLLGQRPRPLPHAARVRAGPAGAGRAVRGGGHSLRGRCHARLGRPIRNLKARCVGAHRKLL